MFVKAMETDGAGDSAKLAEIARALEEQLHAINNEAKYKAKARGIFANLKDPKNSHLRTGLVDGSISPEELATMTYEEMVNPAIRLERQESEKKMMEARRTDWLSENIKQTGDSMMQCRRCKAFKVDYFQMQTRSADEPMTVFYNCKACGFRWKE